jgi:hypothetical protein
MRRLSILGAGILGLLIADVAGAAVLHWSGTMSLIMGGGEVFKETGGGVATVNNSAGLIGGHLTTLRLAN